MHLWEVDHAYYCTEDNYFKSSDIEIVYEYKSLGEFLSQMADADLNYNLLFRWDWQEGEDYDLAPFNGDVNYRNGRLLMFFMHQRKGYHSTSIVEVCRADEQAVIQYLTPRLEHLMSLWSPLTQQKKTPAQSDQG